MGFYLSRRETLEQLKGNVTKSFKSFCEISESVNEKYGEMLTELKQANDNIEKAKNKKERIEAEIEYNNLRMAQVKMEYGMINTSQWKIVESLLLYISALEKNYASIWDNFREMMKKLNEKREEAIKQFYIS